MKDQVNALVMRGVKAASLDSSLTADRTAWVKSEVLSGAIKILYVAPERYVSDNRSRVSPTIYAESFLMFSGSTMSHLLR